MKKILNIIILSFVALGFTSPHTVLSSNTMASSRQAEAPRHSSTVVNSQIAAADDDWVIECVDCQKQITSLGDHFMQLDAEGNPHVAYGGNYLYYAWYDGAAWQYETVDDSHLVGGSASLALDINGYPHISYLDTANNNLLYAFRDATGWHRQTVDSNGDVGWFTSIALDGSGNPHISYKTSYQDEYLETQSNLKYAYHDSINWHTRLVEKLVAGKHSIVLDSAGYPHIGYFGGEDFNLRYIYQDASGWYTQTVDTEAFDSDQVSMVMDSKGNTHLAYCRRWGLDLKYAVREMDGWHTQSTGSESCNSISLALDRKDNPRISNFDGNTRQLIYTYQDQTGWHHQLVGDVGGYWLAYTSLDLDALGEPYIYYGGDGLGLYSYNWTPMGWNLQIIDTGGSVEDAVMTLDEVGYPHFTYLKGNSFTYAYKDPTGWNIMPVEDEVEVSLKFNKQFLALDHQGQPHIIYTQDTSKYVYQDSTGWNIQTLPMTDTVVLSFVLDQQDRAHITYYGSLIYAYYADFNWQTSIVADCSPFYGTPTCGGGALLVDSKGYPHVFFDSLGSFVYAYQDSSGWNYEHLGFADSGWNFFVVMDDKDFPHISFQQNDSVKYVYQDSEGWHLEEVFENGFINSLDLDLYGYPHILFGIFDDEDYSCELMYAYKTDSGWQTQDLENMSCDASLAFDKNGNPHIKYEVHTDQGSNLYYAYKQLSKDGHGTLYIPLIKN